MEILLIALTLIAVALQFYDAWSTIKILREGGRELNPLVRKLMELIGVAPAMIAKSVLISGVLVYLTYLGFTGIVRQGLVVGGFGIVIVWYLVVFFKANFKHDGI